ncbi:phage portal protein [Tomitella gaofuii]|uniref:phage portal protein n=1 Tax=Tomitella gaofuii TaxID=2760083 RepID=UPI001F452EF2|nr:phage portal protein [Tomitella gaofuii]
MAGQTPEQLWREQPYLRMVTGFLARNVAQLGLHCYRHDSGGGRERVRDGVVARILGRPNPEQTGYELIRDLVHDLSLYDDAYLMVVRVVDSPTGWEVRNVPPRWVTGVVGKTAYSVDGYSVVFPKATRPVTVPAGNILHFHGWHPEDRSGGVTPVEALKGTLLEQVEAAEYRRQLWERGGRVGSYISRPKDAPGWSNEGRARFKRGWAASWSGDGAKAGGTPVLEDGMELKRVGFSAKEEEFVEASKLSLQTVAGVYYVNPTMLGQLDNANYSNVREFRKMLYGDTLGPTLAQLEARLNAFLLPMLGAGDGEYVEFNIREKLEGDFNESATQMYQAAGGPYMTRNEIRARMNLPSIEGGDTLIVPLNLGTPEGGVDGSQDEK